MMEMTMNPCRSLTKVGSLWQRLACLSVVTVACVLTAQAGRAVVVSDKVVAVVNDQVITESQWQEHCALANATIAASVTGGQRATQQTALCKRALNAMVDAEIQRQYAETRKLEPSKSELASARAQSAANFKDIPAKLLPVAERELRSELRWQKIMQADVRPKVQVGSAEVDKMINDMAHQRSVGEREIAQILMKVNAPADEDAVHKRMIAVQKRLARGENFATVARDVSEGTEKNDGGMLGWFHSGELNPQLETELDGLKPGQTSGLIRTPQGWHLVKLVQVREIAPISTAPVQQVKLLVVGKAVKGDTAAEDAQLKQLQALRGRMTDEAAVTALVNDPDMDASANIGWVNVKDLQPDMANVVKALKPGSASDVRMVGGNDVIVFKAGDQQVMPQNLSQYRDKVYSHIYNQRMEQEARKLMRDLRQKAFVDIRA